MQQQLLIVNNLFVRHAAHAGTGIRPDDLMLSCRCMRAEADTACVPEAILSGIHVSYT
jgi:hypothetical protein